MKEFQLSIKQSLRKIVLGLLFFAIIGRFSFFANQNCSISVCAIYLSTVESWIILSTICLCSHFCFNLSRKTVICAFLSCSFFLMLMTRRVPSLLVILNSLFFCSYFYFSSLNLASGQPKMALFRDFFLFVLSSLLDSKRSQLFFSWMRALAILNRKFGFMMQSFLSKNYASSSGYGLQRETRALDSELLSTDVFFALTFCQNWPNFALNERLLGYEFPIVFEFPSK